MDIETEEKKCIFDNDREVENNDRENENNVQTTEQCLGNDENSHCENNVDENDLGDVRLKEDDCTERNNSNPVMEGADFGDENEICEGNVGDDPNCDESNLGDEKENIPENDIEENNDMEKNEFKKNDVFESDGEIVNNLNGQTKENVISNDKQHQENEVFERTMNEVKQNEDFVNQVDILNEKDIGDPKSEFNQEFLENVWEDNTNIPRENTDESTIESFNPSTEESIEKIDCIENNSNVVETTEENLPTHENFSKENTNDNFAQKEHIEEDIEKEFDQTQFEDGSKIEREEKTDKLIQLPKTTLEESADIDNVAEELVSERISEHDSVTMENQKESLNDLIHAKENSATVKVISAEDESNVSDVGTPVVEPHDPGTVEGENFETMERNPISENFTDFETIQSNFDSNDPPGNDEWNDSFGDQPVNNDVQNNAPVNNSTEVNQNAEWETEEWNDGWSNDDNWDTAEAEDFEKSAADESLSPKQVDWSDNGNPNTTSSVLMNDDTNTTSSVVMNEDTNTISSVVMNEDTNTTSSVVMNDESIHHNLDKTEGTIPSESSLKESSIEQNDSPREENDTIETMNGEHANEENKEQEPKISSDSFDDFDDEFQDGFASASLENAAFDEFDDFETANDAKSNDDFDDFEDFDDPDDIPPGKQFDSQENNFQSEDFQNLQNADGDFKVFENNAKKVSIMDLSKFATLFTNPQSSIQSIVNSTKLFYQTEEMKNYNQPDVDTADFLQSLQMIRSVETILYESKSQTSTTQRSFLKSLNFEKQVPKRKHQKINLHPRTYSDSITPISTPNSFKGVKKEWGTPKSPEKISEQELDELDKLVEDNKNISLPSTPSSQFSKPKIQRIPSSEFSDSKFQQVDEFDQFDSDFGLIAKVEADPNSKISLQNQSELLPENKDVRSSPLTLSRKFSLKGLTVRERSDSKSSTLSIEPPTKDEKILDRKVKTESNRIKDTTKEKKTTSAMKEKKTTNTTKEKKTTNTTKEKKPKVKRSTSDENRRTEYEATEDPFFQNVEKTPSVNFQAKVDEVLSLIPDISFMLQENETHPVIPQRVESNPKPSSTQTQNLLDFF